MRPQARNARAAPVAAAALKDTNWKPQTSFTESFTVAHPVDLVWDFFANIGAVASCLPGASLAGEPVDGHVNGQIKIKVGPISAEFQGVADVTRDDATRSGTIVGAGKDKRSNSSTRGLIGYSVKQGEAPDQTKVDLTIGFTLTGALAQFSPLGINSGCCRSDHRGLRAEISKRSLRIARKAGPVTSPPSSRNSMPVR